MSVGCEGAVNASFEFFRGTSPAPQTPWIRRKSTICSRFCAAPQSIEATVNPDTDSMKMRCKLYTAEPKNSSNRQPLPHPIHLHVRPAPAHDDLAALHQQVLVGQFLGAAGAEPDADGLPLERLAELEARIVALEGEIARCRAKIEGAVNHRASADALFKR